MLSRNLNDKLDCIFDMILNSSEFISLEDHLSFTRCKDWYDCNDISNKDFIKIVMVANCKLMESMMENIADTSIEEWNNKLNYGIDKIEEFSKIQKSFIRIQ